MKIWIIDKSFHPVPFPRKNRYEIFKEIDCTATVFFSLGFSEYSSKGFMEKMNWEKEEKNLSFINCPIPNFVSKKIKYLLFPISFLIRSLFCSRPDIIIASCPDPFQSLAATICAKIRGSTLIIDFRDYWPEYLIENNRINLSLGKALKFLTKILAQNANCIFAPTDQIYEYLLSRGIYNKPIFLRENLSIPKEDFSQIRNNNIREIQKFILEKKKHGKKIIISGGRFNSLSLSYNSKSFFSSSFIKNNFAFLFVGTGEGHPICHLLESYKIDLLISPALPKNQYYSLLSDSDAVLMFADNNRSFSSNKVYDAMFFGLRTLLLSPLPEKPDEIKETLILHCDANSVSSLKSGFQNVLTGLDEDTKEITKQALINKYSRQVSDLETFLSKNCKN